MEQTRIGALEVIPNVPMGLDLATLTVEQKLQHETDTQNLGKRKIPLLVFYFCARALVSPPDEGNSIILFPRNGEKSPPPREASLAHATPGGPPEGCLATL